MFRLDNLLERWAELYTPLRHNAASRKTFFRISMIDAQSYFIRNYATQPSPCMAYATHIDAELAQQNPKAISYRHVIYFLAKQPAGTLSKTAITDEEGATEARFKTDDMVQDLLAVLWAMKSAVNGKHPSIMGGDWGGSELAAFIAATAADKQYAEGLRGLQLDGAHWGTLPTMFNGWQLCGLTIEQISPRLLCINPERYVQDD
jgi:hypothetical protein